MERKTVVNTYELINAFKGWLFFKVFKADLLFILMCNGNGKEN